jgi:hypothetical protein
MNINQMKFTNPVKSHEQSYIAWSAKCSIEMYFQIIDIYSINAENWASELLWH